MILVILLSKDRIIGVAILLVCVVVAVVYLLALFGYAQIFQSWLNIGSAADVRFWLIAVPVFVSFIAILIIGGWIGWTMLTTPPPKPIEEIATETEPKKEETPITPVPPTEETKPAEVTEHESIVQNTAVESLQPTESKLVEEVKTEISSEPAKESKDRGSKIIDIEGIGPVYAKKLNDNSIYTTTDLLEAGATPTQRKELSQKTAISDQLLLRWINMADLFRIKGVGEEYSDLLEASGVDTVVELSKRVPENLHPKMLEVNADKNLVRRPPSLSEVTRWIQEAKKLPRKINY
jgi:predicted flap endonuclease-1-like 5' DNA nuclease